LLQDLGHHGMFLATVKTFKVILTCHIANHSVLASFAFVLFGGKSRVCEQGERVHERVMIKRHNRAIVSQVDEKRKTELAENGTLYHTIPPIFGIALDVCGTL
jgi:uncharacterized membrane protein